MTKNDLIEKLQSIKGNPIVLLEDTEFGIIPLKRMNICYVHQSKLEPDEYIKDFSFKNEKENTYYHDNFKNTMEECILFSL